MVSVTVWNEYVHEQEDEEVAAVYPDGIHATIAEGLEERGHDVRTATLEEEEHGLTEDVLDETEVLLWWGHRAHDRVSDEVAERVVEAVRDGMGLIPLHSAHFSKPFTQLMGTECFLKWREIGETERLWVVDPSHEIAAGVDDYVEIPRAEMYGEPFTIPEPDRLVFASWFEGGEVFRSGCCFRREQGKVFYFRPGHETYPIYEQEAVRQILDNAVEWAAPDDEGELVQGHQPDPIEDVE